VSTQAFTIQEAFDKVKSELTEKVNSTKINSLIPTGLMERMVILAGGINYTYRDAMYCGGYVQQVVPTDEVIWEPGRRLIIDCCVANKCCKTWHAIDIMKNIFWPNKLNKHYNYPLYREWPFKDSLGRDIKKARIVSTHTHVGDNGEIHLAIEYLWPKGRYVAMRGGSDYDRSFETDTGWTISVMTEKQSKLEYESELLSFLYIDEPVVNEQLLGSSMSRLAFGGVVIMTYTPIGASEMIVAINNMKDKGAKVYSLRGSMYDNHITNGTLNNTGDKAGILTDDNIDDFIKTCAASEVQSRVFGKDIGLSGKVYLFNKEVHVIDENGFHDSTGYDLITILRRSNTFMVMDPHDGYFPFVSWWAFTEPCFSEQSWLICYNEWPTLKYTGEYYDKVRKTLTCKLTPQQISSILKLYDWCDDPFGLPVPRRTVDPIFSKNTESDFRKSVLGLRGEYKQWGIDFEPLNRSLISIGRTHVNEWLKYDTDRELNEYNRPRMYIMDHCHNMIRSLDNQFWSEGKEKESEIFKDPCDTARMLHIMLGTGYKYNPFYRKSRTGKISKGIERNERIEEQFKEALQASCLG
jgi:hypothetical protein